MGAPQVPPGYRRVKVPTLRAETPSYPCRSTKGGPSANIVGALAFVTLSRFPLFVIKHVRSALTVSVSTTDVLGP
jgi:hypothetical protein